MAGFSKGKQTFLQNGKNRKEKQVSKHHDFGIQPQKRIHCGMKPRIRSSLTLQAPPLMWYIRLTLLLTSFPSPSCLLSSIILFSLLKVFLFLLTHIQELGATRGRKEKLMLSLILKQPLNSKQLQEQSTLQSNNTLCDLPYPCCLL